MTVLRRTEQPHQCKPPVGTFGSPTLPLDSLWMCDDCRTVWVSYPPNWFPANPISAWWYRRKARK